MTTRLATAYSKADGLTSDSSAHEPMGLFAGQTVLVVGGTQGLGRQYCVDLAAAGALVGVVGRSASANDIAEDIAAAGGHAFAIVADARDGETIIEAALGFAGTIDAMIVNAGVTRDRSFGKMSEAEWNEVIAVHLGGAFACARAVWPHFSARKRGCILFTTSGAGLHGAFGQANYAAAKAGIIGLTHTLAIEGERWGIRVNAIAPMASTAMTADVFSDALKKSLPVEDVSPFALALVHPSNRTTGQIIEAGGGWASAMRWQRSAGVRFETPDVAAVLSRWKDLGDFTLGADFPRSTRDSLDAAAGDRRSIHTEKGCHP